MFKWLAPSGTGISAGQLNFSTTAFNFGSGTVGTSNSLRTTPTATGSGVAVSSVTPTSSEFSLDGIFPKTVSAGQGVSFTTTTRKASDATSGSTSLDSNAANTCTVETLTGSGTATTLHRVGLSKTPSASVVVRYKVYRSTTSGGANPTVTTVVNASAGYIANSVHNRPTPTTLVLLSIATAHKVRSTPGTSI
jgi:hypothetical protein